MLLYITRSAAYIVPGVVASGYVDQRSSACVVERNRSITPSIALKGSIFDEMFSVRHTETEISAEKQ